MYHLCDHPLAPFTTIAGSTKGPCVNVGVPTVHGSPIFVGEQETRSILKALGWPVPETCAAAVFERDEAAGRVSVLEDELAQARDQIAALELLLGIRKDPAEVEAV